MGVHRKREAEADLFDVSFDEDTFEGVIRAFKWRSVYATWLYFQGECLTRMAMKYMSVR